MSGALDCGPAEVPVSGLDPRSELPQGAGRPRKSSALTISFPLQSSHSFTVSATLPSAITGAQLCLQSVNAVSDPLT